MFKKFCLRFGKKLIKRITKIGCFLNIKNKIVEVHQELSKIFLYQKDFFCRLCIQKRFIFYCDTYIPCKKIYISNKINNFYINFHRRKSFFSVKKFSLHKTFFGIKTIFSAKKYFFVKLLFFFNLVLQKLNNIVISHETLLINVWMFESWWKWQTGIKMVPSFLLLSCESLVSIKENLDKKDTHSCETFTLYLHLCLRLWSCKTNKPIKQVCYWHNNDSIKNPSKFRSDDSIPKIDMK